MSLLTRNLPLLAFYLFLLLLWELVATSGVFPRYLFPSPLEVAQRLIELSEEGRLWPSLQATLRRLILGFGLGAGLGISLGVLMGVSYVTNRSLRSLFLGLQTLPTAAWVPLSLIFFGLHDRGIYFVIMMSSFPAIAIATSDGIVRIPPIYPQVARTFGTPRWLMPFLVFLPAALPNIVTGLKLGFTLAWHGAVSAELIKSSVGLGFLLSMGRELADTAQVIGIMLLTIMAGVLIDKLVFGSIERRIARRWGLAL